MRNAVRRIFYYYYYLNNTIDLLSFSLNVTRNLFFNVKSEIMSWNWMFWSNSENPFYSKDYLSPQCGASCQNGSLVFCLCREFTTRCTACRGNRAFSAQNCRDSFRNIPLRGCLRFYNYYRNVFFTVNFKTTVSQCVRPSRLPIKRARSKYSCIFY